ncbi:MAG: hypothetical protein WC121_04470 [Candidatus Kapaibacterium sp.]
MNIQIAMNIFREFLNKTWDLVNPLIIERYYSFTDEDSYSDWIEANWELLIEKKLLNSDEFLVEYGSGADIYGDSGRITELSGKPTHKVVINSLNGNEVYDYLNKKFITLNNNTFVEFVSFRSGYYFRNPDFNFILFYDEQELERVIKSDEVKYNITAI